METDSAALAVHGQTDYRDAEGTGRGVKRSDVCREQGVSSATFYRFKAKFGGVDLNGACVFHLGSDSEEKDGTLHLLSINPTNSPRFNAVMPALITGFNWHTVGQGRIGQGPGQGVSAAPLGTADPPAASGRITASILPRHSPDRAKRPPTTGTMPSWRSESASGASERRRRAAAPRRARGR